MHYGTKRHILKEWRDLASRLMPVVETADGEIYYQLKDVPGGLVWEYGGACNTGLLVDGTVEYDEFLSLNENIQNIVSEIKPKGYLK